MERERINKTPTAILCSDFHLREDIPICYTGNYWKDQWDTVDFISDLQKKYNCPVIHAGDLFDKWKPSPWLLTETMKHIPAKFFSCMGQHDLPQHSIDLVHKSGFGTIKEAEYIKTAEDWELNSSIYFCHYSQEPPLKRDRRIKNILVWHHMTYQKKPFPGATDGFAAGILRKYPDYDLICCGDNHQSFVEEYEGRLLVNPGSMMRMDADQADFKPSVYLWFAEDNTVKRIYLPIQENVISREHIDIKEQRDARIDAFVSKLNGEYVAEMSFEDNLENFFKVNNIREPVKEIIYKSLDNGKIN